MKKHTLFVDIITFSIIFLFFLLPPFFTDRLSDASDIFSAWNFPLGQFILFLLALLLYFFYFERQKKNVIFFPVIMTTSLLFCVALFIKFLSLLLVTENTYKISLPDSFISWIFCLLNFSFAAFYEEVVYRFYFPDQLISFLSLKIKWKYLGILCEVISCLVFALAHLYLGVFSVINAVFGHIILRVYYKKTGLIWTGFVSHFIYNVISLILL